STRTPPRRPRSSSRAPAPPSPSSEHVPDGLTVRERSATGGVGPAHAGPAPPVRRPRGRVPAHRRARLTNVARGGTVAATTTPSRWGGRAGLDEVCPDVYAVALRCPAPVSRPPLTAAPRRALDATPVRHVPRGAQVLA